MKRPAIACIATSLQVFMIPNFIAVSPAAIQKTLKAHQLTSNVASNFDMD